MIIVSVQKITFVVERPKAGENVTHWRKQTNKQKTL